MASFPKPDGKRETLDEMRRLLRDDEDQRRELVGDMSEYVSPLVGPESEGVLYREGKNSYAATPINITGHVEDEPETDSAAEDPEPIGRPQEDAPAAPIGRPQEDAPDTDSLAPAAAPDVDLETYGTPAPDHSSDLVTAQGDASKQRLLREMLTAGSMVVRGVTGSDSVDDFRRDEALAERPIQDALARIKLGKDDEADRRAFAQWNYERTRREQEFGAKQAGDQARLARDLDADGERLRANGARERMDADRLKETERHNRAMEARPVGMPPWLQAASPVRSPVDERAADARLDSLAKDTAKVSNIVQALQNIDQIVPGITDGATPPEYAKFGDTETRLKGWVEDKLGASGQITGPEVANFRRAVDQFKDLVARERTGAVINPGELMHYERLISNGALADPQVFAKAMKQFKALVYSKLHERQSAAGTGRNPVLERYESVGGMTYRNPFFKSVARPEGPAARESTNSVDVSSSAPALPTDIPVREPSGAPAPAPKPAAPKPSAGKRRLTMEDGSVWEEGPNGEAIMLSPPKR
jgi:hypothetical protein